MRHSKGFYLIYLVPMLTTVMAYGLGQDKGHALNALASLLVLSIAALQASLIALQSYMLKSHSQLSEKLLGTMLPLETMQFILLQLMWLGVILLSITVFGALGMPDISNTSHVAKLAIAITAWLLFATLLYGHYRVGWDMQVVATRTIIGVALLSLGTILCSQLL